MSGRVGILTQWMLVPIWGLLVGIGMFQVISYDSTPTPSATAPEMFPHNMQMFQTQVCPKLMIFVHPHCPCSGSTIGELERIVARLDSGVSINVVFWHPNSVPPNWHETTLWTQASRIPRVNLIDDAGCDITRSFAVTTSGQTLFYDQEGRLQFSGGITKSRGHSGDNFGSDVLLGLTRKGSCSTNSTPMCCEVYGCPLIANGRIASTSEGKQ